MTQPVARKWHAYISMRNSEGRAMNRKGFCFFLGAISGRATTASESVKAWIGILEISSSPPLSASEAGVDGVTGVGRESLPPARDAFFGGRLAGIVVCLGG